LTDDPAGREMDPSQRSSLLEFPCSFPIKVMGKAEEGFEELVVGIVARHVGELDDHDVESRPSRKGSYILITVTFTATSRAQLDDLYQELSANERVSVVL
jgi:putative lipoic acid-binding regulatory protein